uniref:Histone deacetylase family protein, putative n=1 Tax=Theileria annulata TaxID=5874 RepID=A0A3B0MS19_THEAN
MNNLNESAPFIPVYKTSCNIHKIILKNDLETLKNILSDGSRDCLNDLDHFGRTPFHVALLTANPKALYLLLYYPLIHNSELFVTTDWIDLEENCDKDVDFRGKKDFDENQFLEHKLKSEHLLSRKSSISRDSTQFSAGEMDLNDGIEYISSKYIDYTKARLRSRSPSFCSKTHSEYLDSGFSIDEWNYMCESGQKEVETLYEEHYKLLVGESHELETAAKNYSLKYRQIYALEHSRRSSKEFKITTKMDNINMELQFVGVQENKLSSECSPEKDEMIHSTSLNGTIQDTTNPESDYFFSQLNTTFSLTVNDNEVTTGDNEGISPDKLNQKLSFETSEKLYKGLMPLETVDLIATFDKTSPLHLLFSNVYISSYRSNMLKCFRILLCYFNKLNEFQKVYKSLDYALHAVMDGFPETKQGSPKSAEIGRNKNNRKSLNANNNERTGFDQKLTNRRKNMSPSRSKNPPESGRTGIRQKMNWLKKSFSDGKRGMKDDFNDFENGFKRQKKYGSQGLNFPNNTLCSDVLGMEQIVDGRMNELLNCSNTQTSNESDSIGPYDECDLRSNDLHKMMTSFIWLKPKASWETFIKDRDFSKSTILHRVCNLKDINVVKLILASGFSPIVVNETGDMPVHLSVDAKDPYTFLTILHSTLKHLFTHSYKNNTLNTRNKDNSLNSAIDGEAFELFMSSLCKRLKGGSKRGFKWYQRKDSDEFEWISPVSIKTLFDEFLILFEQLVCRSIKASSWECLLALFSYNSAITYHLISNPHFMHRFINFATMMNNSGEFLNLVNFVLTNLFDNPNITAEEHNYKNQNKQEEDYFKGYGIPHSGLRSSVMRPELGPKTYHLQANSVLSRSVRLQENNLKTWVITHPTCLHHLATPEPTDAPNKRHRLIVTYPENPTRLEVIISNDNGLLRSETLENVKLIHSPPPASMADILRVHDWAYIDKLLEQVQVAQKRWITNPYWPVLADGDTPVTPHSWSAALYAAGSVLTAIDAVCTNQCGNAFCAVRPPGHHLGTWGAAQTNNFEDEDFAAGSQGFCLINNVAIGAAYAKYMYASKGIRRIAIVDFDVHHGNGTEQVVRNIGPKNVKINNTSYKVDNEGNINFQEPITQQIIHKKWFGWLDENDRDEVLFASIHAYDGTFYPGTGRQSTIYMEENRPNIINVAVPQGTTSTEFRSLFETKICPYVYHFRPDLILISAGFDGHYRDSMSCGFTRYTEKDFNYVTELLVTVANTVCEGRVVSVLEGGYNTRLGTLSPFARSVLEHVTALNNTGKNRKYPFMYGENSINHLLSPVVKTLEENVKPQNSVPEAASVTNSVSNSDSWSWTRQLKRNASTELLFKAYKLRVKTDLLTSKLYSRCSKFCYHKRLLKLDRTNMATKFVFDFYGNLFFSYYSKFFYTLFGISPALRSCTISVDSSLNNENPNLSNSVDTDNGVFNGVEIDDSPVTLTGIETERDPVLNSFDDFVSSYLQNLDLISNILLDSTNTDTDNTLGTDESSVDGPQMVNQIEVGGRDLNELLMDLKGAYYFKESDNLMSRSKWAANEKLSALNRNLEVVVKLDDFYSKFSSLFDKECHIH